jgi:hypothetical protein
MTAPDRIREHRSVELCSDADALHGERDRSRLWAYGYAGIAELAGCPVEAVRDAVTRKRFDPGDLLDVARWVQERRARQTVTFTVGPLTAAGSVFTINAHGAPVCGGVLRVTGHRLDHHGMDLYSLECERCHRHSERMLAGGTCNDMHPDHRPPYTITVSSDCDDEGPP